ncbi:MAG: hypothetical protein ACU837_14825 [Gammaproteobacteria bacterium]
MSNVNLRAALLGLLTLATPGALGCGPDFPEELIPNRKDALFEPPPATFTREVQKLTDARRRDLPLAETDDPEAQRRHIEAAQRPVDAADTIAAMRQAENGDAAYALGTDLPEAVRLYTAAAVDYRRAFPPLKPQESNNGYAYASDTEAAAQSPELTYEQQTALADQAQQRFTAVLALPPQQNTERAVWSSFMLGKLAALQGDVSEAAAQFRRTREQVKAGLPDPLGLAVASYGEEARLHFIPGELGQAAGLYVQQLSYGSHSASNSLKFLAAKMLKNADWLDDALAQPITRKLVFLYLYTQNVGNPFYSLDNYVYAQHSDAESEQHGAEAPAASADAEAGAVQAPPDAWARIAAALEKQTATDIEGADWLAAAAYQKGRYALAERVVRKSATPLAYWVKAKLALRAGNQQAALAAYARAADAFPVEHDTSAVNTVENPAAQSETPQWPDASYDASDAPWVYRIDAERGVLRLARGEYLQALTHLYAAAAQYWTDTAYVAERVLTVDELKGFVDRQVTAPSAEQVATALRGDSFYAYLPPALQIRQLLARRLMREGRLSEAENYFDNPELRTLAKNYRELFRQARNRWQSDLVKARAWFALARLTRNKGMELMGYELAPDFTNWDGLFASAGGPDEISGEFSSDDERRRFEAHRAKPDVRFHYRIIAANYAVKAADLLPHSSQAFAAVLCEATRWNLVRQPEYARPLYHRYLREGPYVEWGKNFGQQCPNPDFAGAKKRLWAERLTTVTHSWITYVLLLLAIAGAAAYRLVTADNRAKRT